MHLKTPNLLKSEATVKVLVNNSHSQIPNLEISDSQIGQSNQ